MRRLGTVMFAASLSLATWAADYQVGDRVEVRWAGDETWHPAVVLEIRGDRYFVQYERENANAFYTADRIRPVAGGRPQRPGPTPAPPASRPPQPAPASSAPAAGGVPQPDRPVLTCPVPQQPARKGDRPDAELLKKIIRCGKGEKTHAPEGTVTIDVTALQIGAPRDWHVLHDIGTGTPGTRVFPVKATYTEKTWYKTRTAVGENWIRIFNFYVDSFGEWRYGSQESVKGPDNRDDPPRR